MYVCVWVGVGLLCWRASAWWPRLQGSAPHPSPAPRSSVAEEGSEGKNKEHIGVCVMFGVYPVVWYGGRW